MNNIYTWDNDTGVVKNNQVAPDDETDLDDIDFKADIDDGDEDVQEDRRGAGGVLGGAADGAARRVDGGQAGQGQHGGGAGLVGRGPPDDARVG